MKTIAVSSRAKTVNALLKQAVEENLILRTEDGREFVLAQIDNFDREIELTQQNKELMRLLDQRGRERATVSLQEARTHTSVSWPT